MNEVILFKDITTEEALQAIEAYSLKYNADIVADMNDDNDRRVIKKEASEIADMRKAVERARIDKKKAYGDQVDKEAAIIDARLAKANEPFDVLINKYNAERKRILAAENARKKAIEDQAAIDSDYEIAVLMMDKHFSDKAKAEQERLEHEERLRLEDAKQAQEAALLAAEQERAASIEREKQAKLEAEQAEIRRANQEAAAKQALADAEARRLADIEAEKQRAIDEQVKKERDAEDERIKAASDAEHVKQVNYNIKSVYLAAGFPDEWATKATKLLVNNKLPNTKFNY